MSRPFRIVPKSTCFALPTNDCRTALGMAGAISAIIFTYESLSFIAKFVDQQSPKSSTKRHTPTPINTTTKPLREMVFLNQSAHGVCCSKRKVGLLTSSQSSESQTRDLTQAFSRRCLRFSIDAEPLRGRAFKKNSCMGSYNMQTSHTRETETSTTVAELQLPSSAHTLPQFRH